MPRVFRLAAALAPVALLALQAPAQSQPAPGSVIVNGVPLTADTIGRLQATYGFRAVPGRYWYDRISGLWGFEGRGPYGQILPGEALGGPLRPDASGGGTGVFSNGRELHPSEVAILGRCITVVPGRYTTTADGTVRHEGSYFPLVNLPAACGSRGVSGRSAASLGNPALVGRAVVVPGVGVFSAP